MPIPGHEDLRLVEGGPWLHLQRGHIVDEGLQLNGLPGQVALPVDGRLDSDRTGADAEEAEVLLRASAHR